MKTFRICLALLCSMSIWADTATYTYDDAGRLTRVDYGTGQSITYTYDNAGNLLGRVISSAYAGAPSAREACGRCRRASATRATSRNANENPHPHKFEQSQNKNHRRGKAWEWQR